MRLLSVEDALVGIITQLQRLRANQPRRPLADASASPLRNGAGRPTYSATDDEKCPDWVDLSVRRTPTDAVYASRPSSDMAVDVWLSARCPQIRVQCEETGWFMSIGGRYRGLLAPRFLAAVWRVISLRKMRFDLLTLIGTENIACKAELEFERPVFWWQFSCPVREGHSVTEDSASAWIPTVDVDGELSG